ncbi:MAG: glycoside hydrolase family 28 protein [Janthinobacterium lividum]
MNKFLFALACVILLFAGNFASGQSHDITFYTKNAPFKMPDVPEPVISTQTFSVTNFGAVSDGKTLNTQAFAKTIAACSAAGGGHVIVPAGNWQTGPIEMKSNVDLHVEKGANVVFTANHTQYPMMAESKNSYVVTPPIWGNKLENVSITGEGSFDGNGQSWRPLKKSKVNAAEWQSIISSGGVLSADGKIWWPSRDALNGETYLKQLKSKTDVTTADYLPARDYLRPKMVVINNSKNLMIDGPTFKNSPMFVINPKGIINLIIRNTKVYNDYSAQNGDGIDISASKNVVIYKTTVSAGDDGICMKSSGNGDENTAALENVLIAECTVLQGHGGFVIGSNTDGGMKNIYVTNCNFLGTDIGIRVKSNAGRGGSVHAVFIDQISMSKILNEAVLFDTYYEDVPAGKEKGAARTVNDKVPDFHDFYISNIICKGAKTAVFFRGLPEMPVHDIHFKNVNIEAGEGVIAQSIKDIEFKNVKLVTSKQPAINPADFKFIKVVN